MTATPISPPVTWAPPPPRGRRRHQCRSGNTRRDQHVPKNFYASFRTSPDSGHRTWRQDLHGSSRRVRKFLASGARPHSAHRRIHDDRRRLIVSTDHQLVPDPLQQRPLRLVIDGAHHRRRSDHGRRRHERRRRRRGRWKDGSSQCHTKRILGRPRRMGTAGSPRGLAKSRVALRTGIRSLISEIGVHARYPIAAPCSRCVAQAHFAPQLSAILHQFVETGVIRDSERSRFHAALAGHTQAALLPRPANIATVGLAHLIAASARLFPSLHRAAVPVSL